MDVSVLVKILYIVFASAKGLCVGNKDGLLFCIIILLSLIFKKLVFVCVCSSV